MENIDQEINSLDKNTTKFEIALRTSLNTSNSNNHIEIQRINILCNSIKESVRKLLNIHWLQTAKKFKVEQVTSRANFFIQKYELAISLWIKLHWDILAQLWKYKTKKED